MEFTFSAPNEIHPLGDKRYKIVRETNPWQDSDPKVWYSVRINMYGPFVYQYRKTFPRALEAMEWVEEDANDTKVFIPNAEGLFECRWCGLGRDYLEAAPAWWFGCNLCETEMDKFREVDPYLPKITYGAIDPWLS